MAHSNFLTLVLFFFLPATILCLVALPAFGAPAPREDRHPIRNITMLSDPESSEQVTLCQPVESWVSHAIVKVHLEKNEIILNIIIIKSQVI